MFQLGLSLKFGGARGAAASAGPTRSSGDVRGSATPPAVTSGTIVQIDDEGKTFVVDVGEGRSETIRYSDATRITGGAIRVGARVRVQLQQGVPGTTLAAEIEVSR